MGSLVLLCVVVALVPVHVLSDTDADQDQQEEDEGQGDAKHHRVCVVIKILNGLLVDLRCSASLSLFRFQGARFNSAEVLSDHTLWLCVDVVVGVFLEVQLQRNPMVKLNARDAAHKALVHGVVFADVQVPDVVELGVCT